MRLSSPIEKIKEHYHAVVVGSGYGGAIAASRLARAGKQVCLLERGREKWPGEYPDTKSEIAREAQFDTLQKHVGSRLAMFDFHVNQDMNVLVGCGLGGTSLINASVALEVDERVWEKPAWPPEVRADRDTRIKKGCHLAREMLRPNPYPDDAPPLPKLRSLEKSAAFIGRQDRFYRPPININFERFENDTNHVGVTQYPDDLSGDDVSGSNSTGKNTTLMNYIPDAWNHGAEIFTEVRVQYLERQDGRWLVHYQPFVEGRRKFDAPTLFLTADIVVLAAGCLGSTEILLRSQAKGLPLSSRLGEDFTGQPRMLYVGVSGVKCIPRPTVCRRPAEVRRAYPVPHCGHRGSGGRLPWVHGDSAAFPSQGVAAFESAGRGLHWKRRLPWFCL